jgi:hypothetical protein
MNDAGALDRLPERLTAIIYDELAGLPLRDTTKDMICRIVLDLPLTPAQQDDFGVYTPDHYRAIRAVLVPRTGRTLRDAAVELDRCLGKGPALNKLVCRIAPEYADVNFATAWDAFGFP